MGLETARRRWRRSAAVPVALALLVAACGGDEEAGPPTLRLYASTEVTDAFSEAAAACTAQSGGRWRIEMVDLPRTADAQREQLVRRLAAEDSDVDLVGMDVIWTPEFAEAGWVLPWEGADADEASEGVFQSALDTATWDGTLYAATLNTNTQLLYYRTDLVPQPPETWDEMIDMAEQLPDDRNTIAVQGRRYEGLTVWFTALLASAGGQVVDEQGEVALPEGPTQQALSVMRRLAHSSAASASLSNANEQETHLSYNSGEAAFMLNYTYAYGVAEESAPDVFANTGVARWPRVEPDLPSRPTIGGIDLGVGAFTEHPEEAFEAAKCLHGPESQLSAVERGGLPPTLIDLYDTPEVRQAFPFADVLRETLEDSALRAQTPAYNSISLAVQRIIHPPRAIDPEGDVAALRDLVDDAINSRGLL